MKLLRILLIALFLLLAPALFAADYPLCPTTMDGLPICPRIEMTGEECLKLADRGYCEWYGYISVAAPVTAHLSPPIQFALPDPKLTPGVTRDLSLKMICTTVWGKDARHVTDKMKKDVCLAYGIRKGCPGRTWTLDHLISRELGGADDTKNLWPQEIHQAHVKDKLENAAHKLVCAGKISLKEAQEKIAKNWVVLYREVFGGDP